MPIGGQLGGRPGGQLGGQVLPSMVSPTPSQVAAEQTKQKELQTYIERVAAGQDKPQTVNITYYERPHPRDPNTVIVGYRATTDQPLRFQSNYTSYETQVKAGTDYKQALEKTALQGVKAYYHLGADDTIAIQGKVVQSPTYSPQVLGIAQQVAQEKQAYDVKLASLREQQQEQLKAGITFQAEQTAKIRELQAKTASMSPTQAADYLKGELKGYYGKDVLAGVRYTVGDRTFSDPKLAERYAAQLSQQQEPRGLPQDVLKPIFVGGKPNVELFEKAKTVERGVPQNVLPMGLISEPSIGFYRGTQKVAGAISEFEQMAGRGAKRIEKGLPSAISPYYMATFEFGKGLFLGAPRGLVETTGMIPGGVEVIAKTKGKILPIAVTEGTRQLISSSISGLKTSPFEFAGAQIGTIAILGGGARVLPKGAKAVKTVSMDILSTQKPIMRSFLTSEEAVLKPRRTVTLTQLLERPKAATEKTVETIEITGITPEGTLIARPVILKPKTEVLDLTKINQEIQSKLILRKMGTIDVTPFKEAKSDILQVSQFPRPKISKAVSKTISKGELLGYEPSLIKTAETAAQYRARIAKVAQKAKPISITKSFLIQESKLISKPISVQKAKAVQRPVLISLMKPVSVQRMKPVMIQPSIIKQKEIAKQKAKAISIAVAIPKMALPSVSPQIMPIPAIIIPLIPTSRTIVPEFPRMPTPEIARPPIEGARGLKRLPFLSTDITTEFFRRKDRRRKEKAKKGSVIAPIITPSQILRGGVLFRGSLLRRARRFK